MPERAPSLLWAPYAWLGTDAAAGWCESVVLRIGAAGRWAEIAPGVAPPDGAVRLAGPALPGLVDAHSHAFQRAIAGLTEVRTDAHDDFWSWRERMYAVAQRVTPEQLRAVAGHLYRELLLGGYTHVCEFHYLHHAPDGRPYPDRLEMSWALADAATDAGIGLTILPVLYERAGFAQPELRDEQRRFGAGADEVIAMQRELDAAGRPLVTTGVAVHSLRAAAPESIARLVDRAGDGPIHMHVAEQTGEVDDCVAATGLRPLEWAARHAGLDARWHLVHATHATPAEIDAVSRSGAGVVLCPGTEANLGDGFTDLPGWLAAGVPIAIGSDSNTTRDWREELRLAEYGQRLSRRARNVCADAGAAGGSTAGRLWSRALDASPRAAGMTRWGLEPGARADLLVVDTDDPALTGIPVDRLLDALVFSTPTRPWRDVMVAGRLVVRDRRGVAPPGAPGRFETAMAELAGTMT